MPVARILSTVPVLMSRNLQESIDFYTVRLGFILMVQMEDYAIVGRDGCEIHLNIDHDHDLMASHDNHSHSDCYIRTGSTDALFEEFSAAGLKLQPPQVLPWGMKELHVTDPHGNQLRFGEMA